MLKIAHKKKPSQIESNLPTILFRGLCETSPGSFATKTHRNLIQQKNPPPKARMLGSGWLVGWFLKSLTYFEGEKNPFVESLERGTSPFQPVPWVVVPGLLPLRRDRCRGCCHLLIELKDQWKGRDLGKWWKNGETTWNFQINWTIKHQYSPRKMNRTMSFQDPASPPNIWHNWKRG